MIRGSDIAVAPFFQFVLQEFVGVGAMTFFRGIKIAAV
jgi:hypothetical protein